MRSGSIPRRLIGSGGGLDNGNLRHDVPSLDLHEDIHPLHDLAEHCVPAVQRGLWRHGDVELTPRAIGRSGLCRGHRSGQVFARIDLILIL